MSTGSFHNATIAAAVPTQFAEGRGYSPMILTTSMHALVQRQVMGANAFSSDEAQLHQGHVKAAVITAPAAAAAWCVLLPAWLPTPGTLTAA